MLSVMPIYMEPNACKLFQDIPYQQCDTYFNAKSALCAKLQPEWSKFKLKAIFEERRHREREMVDQFVSVYNLFI